MKLVQVAEQNKKYYTKEFIHGFNTGAKTQYEADRKERRGRWVWSYEDIMLQGHYECSCCGWRNYATQLYTERDDFNYCPNCGVRMVNEDE